MLQMCPVEIVRHAGYTPYPNYVTTLSTRATQNSASQFLPNAHPLRTQSRRPHDIYAINLSSLYNLLYPDDSSSVAHAVPISIEIHAAIWLTLSHATASPSPLLEQARRVPHRSPPGRHDPVTMFLLKPSLLFLPCLCTSCAVCGTLCANMLALIVILLTHIHSPCMPSSPARWSAQQPRYIFFHLLTFTYPSRPTQRGN